MSSSEAELWASSGALELTGRADGPPLHCVGAPATAVQTALDDLARLGVVGLPDIALLSERARLSGLTRSAPFSVGGRFRIMPTRDGWFGLSLARDTDTDAIPALVEGPCGPDPWEAIGGWLASVTSAEAGERTALLGLAAAPVPSEPPPVRRTSIVIAPGGRRSVLERPLVVDLTSLWAGPLCAHILGLAGARVVKVESRTRPDGARKMPAFFDILHAGHEFVTLNFADSAELAALVATADVVLEASRPRALRQLGIDAAAEVARGAIWVSITAYGRDGPDAMRVGFGDDVASGAGLVAWERDVPHPAGDALADPLAGVTAAVAAVEALSSRNGMLVDVSMHDVAVSAAWG